MLRTTSRIKSNRAHRPHRLLSWAMLPAIVLAITALPGCTKSSGGGRHRTTSSVSKAETGDIVFDSVVDTLNRLDDRINMNLRPPVVVLDATKSRNHKTVMATITEFPNQKSGPNPISFLYVHSNNGQFGRLKIQPGDRVRIYSLKDEYGKIDYLDLSVHEVLGDNQLSLNEALHPKAAVRRPTRMEIWRFSTDQETQIERRLVRYRQQAKRAIGWEPTPDESGLEQIIDWLNQWARSRTPEDTWSPDPLVATIPEQFQSEVAANELAEMLFDPYDARLLQEAIWLRDVSTWGKGEGLDALGQAEQLFDWTVRNVQLVTRNELTGRHRRPWQTLLYGQGTGEERAWVFALLCRQQGLDVVMLAREDSSQPGGLAPWLPALWHNESLYLFDPWLGMPIPGKEKGQIATLAAVLADGDSFGPLDLDPQNPYPRRLGEDETLIALVPASPFHLSRRAELMEKHLAGDAKMRITVQPSNIAERMAGAPQIAEVRIWDLPYRTAKEQRTREAAARQKSVAEFLPFALKPELWKARVLHLQGQFDGEKSAQTYYRRSRPSDTTINHPKRDPAEKYIMSRAKQYASYWLGLLSEADGNDRVAIDYLEQRTLAASPDGPWTRGAHYNLARIYEKLGETDNAKKHFLADESDPQSFGNRLRARTLDGNTKAAAKK